MKAVHMTLFWNLYISFAIVSHIGPCLAANNGLNSLGRLFKVGLTHTAVIRNQWALGILCERVA